MYLGCTLDALAPHTGRRQVEEGQASFTVVVRCGGRGLRASSQSGVSRSNKVASAQSTLTRGGQGVGRTGLGIDWIGLAC